MKAVDAIEGGTFRRSIGVSDIVPSAGPMIAPSPAVRLTLAVAGVTPVTLIAATAFGLAELRALAAYVLIPVILAATLVVVVQRRAATLLATALAAGLVSTLLYDTFRFAFLGAGLMQGDPIPHIGEALHLRPAWVVGYLWRYIGNGTGLAIVFLVLGLQGVRAGALYGLCVCAGLVLTLALSPFGQQLLFPLTPTAILMATGGHAIYGAALGWIADRLGCHERPVSGRGQPGNVPGSGLIAA